MLEGFVESSDGNRCPLVKRVSSKTSNLAASAELTQGDDSDDDDDDDDWLRKLLIRSLE